MSKWSALGLFAGGWGGGEVAAHSSPHLEPDEAKDVKEDKFDFSVSILRLTHASLLQVFKSHISFSLAPSTLSSSSSTQWEFTCP